MKPTNMIATFTAAALIGGQGYAENYTPPKEPPKVEEPSGGVDASAVFLVLLGLVVLNAANRSRVADDLTVTPQNCMNKHGVFVECE